MADFENMKPQDLLDQVNKAITTVLVGGQSYKIGSRSLTRADLALLRSMKSDLEAQVAAEGENGLLGRTFVVYFEGR
jgi:hypothetical protein